MITRYYLKSIIKRIAFYTLALMVSSIIVSCGDDEPSSNVVDLTNAKETNDGYYDGLLYYKLTSYSEAKVTKCNPEAIEVDIPGKVALNGKTYSVSAIDNEAFYKRKNLTKVIIPNSVTSIGDDAFKECNNLTNVKIGEGVISIGNQAFYGCFALTNVNIPNSVTSIGYGAFYGCRTLNSIIIPNSVTSIGSVTFMHCTGLTNVSLGKSVTTIGYGAFWYCSSLTTVTIPSSVIEIDREAFADCSKLSSVTCMAITPPRLPWGFGGYSTHCDKLLVPKSSVEAYKSSRWNEAFSQIVGI